LLLAALATAFATAVPVGAAPTTPEIPTLPSGVPIATDKDNTPSPMAVRQSELRAIALEAQAHGKDDTNEEGVARAEKYRGRYQFVELEREDEDLIWTVLGEFGPLDSNVPVGPPFGDLTSGVPGPLHNEIPEPNRRLDNATIWRADFNQQSYEELLFSAESGANSMRNYYIEQSSGRYAVDGDVTDWGVVPFNAAHYGRDWCGDIVCATTWWFVEDSVNSWYEAQLAAGMTADEIDAYLSQFDVWDRYDHDGDGNFDEADGYIDHFQSVHAGEGQETGGGAQGDDAIWSHRWYVQLTPIGDGGPTLDDGTVVPFGGTQVGQSKYWIGDYTIEPENGGLGVFAHEFGHDLNLDDLYDTSGNTCGSTCENSTGFWTLMSSGSYLGNGRRDIGSAPGHMGAFEKFQLGWLDYEVTEPDAGTRHRLTPAEGTTTSGKQGLFVVLPDKEVTETIATPDAGANFYYSGAANNLDVIMHRPFTVAAGETLTARVNFDIETDWDYAYLVVSTDGGATWTEVQTNRSSTTDPNGQNFGFGITGASGGWVDLTAGSLPTGNVLIGFRYWTDGAVVNPGFMVDQITVGDEGPFGAEGDDGFTLDGFRVTTGTETNFYFNAYIAENRQYVGYDRGLRTGPYNFGFLDDPDRQNWVEHFPYQNGLLISYWDASQTDNSTSAHPGEGMILPIDSHPRAMLRADGEVWRSRIQSYDSTFSTDRTDRIRLHWESESSVHRSQRGVRTFDDSIQYWNPETPTAGVINPSTGTKITITRENRRYIDVKVD
jgi:immune inhibitor A